MNELDNLAGGVAIPYLDYPVYMVRIIYPDANSERQRSMLLTPPDRAGTSNLFFFFFFEAA